MPISTIFTALFYPYIAHERTTQTLILSVRSVRSALCLKERHRSQKEGSLKSKERLSSASFTKVILQNSWSPKISQNNKFFTKF